MINISSMQEDIKINKGSLLQDDSVQGSTVSSPILHKINKPTPQLNLINNLKVAQSNELDSTYEESKEMVPDAGADGHTIRPSIIRSQSGQYYQLQIIAESNSSALYLSLYSKQSRRNICTRLQIPNDFITKVITEMAANNEDDYEQIEAVKRAIEVSLKNSS